MKKKKEPLFVPFESNYSNNKFLKLAEDMMNSKAWRELSTYDIRLYLEMKRKFTKSKTGDYNTNNISMPKSEYEKFMNQRTFGNSIDNLIELGFIRVIETRWNTRECTIYGFSDQWKHYGTTKFNVTSKDRRLKKIITDEQKEHIILALNETNLKKKEKSKK